MRPQFVSVMTVASALTLAGTGFLGGCTNSARDSHVSAVNPPRVVADTSGAVELKDAHGVVRATATLTQTASGVEIGIYAKGLPAGIHGVHIHEKGVCTPDADPAKNFTSAGGHYQAPGHTSFPPSGDLTSILVNKDGTGKAVLVSDAFNLKDLSAGSGTSLVIHEKPGNFGNIPARYTSNGKPGPDETSLHTSDAGNRIACGVISAGS